MKQNSKQRRKSKNKKKEKGKKRSLQGRGGGSPETAQKTCFCEKKLHEIVQQLETKKIRF